MAVIASVVSLAEAYLFLGEFWWVVIFVINQDCRCGCA